MLPSKNRLVLNNNNKKQLKQRITSYEFTLLFNKKRENVLKAAIVVSKKVAPLAVDRNKIKRIITESLKDKLEIGIETIIKANINVANLKKNEIAEKIEKLFKKIT